MKYSTDWWNRVLLALGTKLTVAAQWAPYFAQVIDGPHVFSLGEAELDDFLANVLHESRHLECLEENLNYSAEGLCNTWPTRFPTLEDAVPYARRPREIAIKVYSNRLGNGGALTDDGWNYRGGGPIQGTGKKFYEFASELTGVDLVANPDKLRKPGVAAVKIALAWWEKNIPDSLIGNIPATRKRVNGGDLGLKKVSDLTNQAQKELDA